MDTIPPFTPPRYRDSVFDVDDLVASISEKSCFRLALACASEGGKTYLTHAFLHRMRQLKRIDEVVFVTGNRMCRDYDDVMTSSLAFEEGSLCELLDEREQNVIDGNAVGHTVLLVRRVGAHNRGHDPCAYLPTQPTASHAHPGPPPSRSSTTSSTPF